MIEWSRRWLSPRAPLLVLLAIISIGAVMLGARGEATSFVADDPTDVLTYLQQTEDHVPQVDWPVNKVVLPTVPVSYRARPAEFGTSTDADGYWGTLAPISLYTNGDDLACGKIVAAKKSVPPPDWIALVERGGCPFADKVRNAQTLGASAVIVGDAHGEPDSDFYFDFPALSPEDDLGRSGGRLLTMRSDSNTSDIVIPSGFVIRPSYLELLMHTQPSGIRAGVFLDQALDDIELFDVGLLLLVLPACFMLFVIVSHYVRAAIKRYMDRAPLIAIQRLPCYAWKPDGEWERVSPAVVQARNETLSAPPPARGLDRLVEVIASGILAVKRVLGFGRIQVEETVDISPGAPRFADDSCPICLIEFAAECVITDPATSSVCSPVDMCSTKTKCACWLTSDDWLGRERKYCPTCKRDITA